MQLKPFLRKKTVDIGYQCFYKARGITPTILKASDKRIESINRRLICINRQL